MSRVRHLLHLRINLKCYLCTNSSLKFKPPFTTLSAMSFTLENNESINHENTLQHSAELFSLPYLSRITSRLDASTGATILAPAFVKMMLQEQPRTPQSSINTPTTPDTLTQQTPRANCASLSRPPLPKVTLIAEIESLYKNDPRSGSFVEFAFGFKTNKPFSYKGWEP